MLIPYKYIKTILKLWEQHRKQHMKNQTMVGRLKNSSPYYNRKTENTLSSNVSLTRFIQYKIKKHVQQNNTQTINNKL